MSSTRSPLRPGRATEPGQRTPALLIAAHGDIGGTAPNAALRALADAVRTRLADMPVACGVLNGEPAIEAAFADLADHRVLVYPLFMSGGHYVETALPARLGLAGNADAARHVTILPPFGLNPALPALVARQVRRAAPANPCSAAGTEVLVIAHGSARSRQPRQDAERFAGGLGQCLPRWPVRTAYLEEPPFAEDAIAALPARSIVVSFFAGKGCHGGFDVPKFLAKAGKGYVPVVGPLGADPEIADLVVTALKRRLPAVSFASHLNARQHPADDFAEGLVHGGIECGDRSGI